MTGAFAQMAAALLGPLSSRECLHEAADVLRAHGDPRVRWVADSLAQIADGHPDPKALLRVKVRPGGRFEQPGAQRERAAEDRLLRALYEQVPALERNRARLVAAWVRTGDPRVPAELDGVPVKLPSSEARIRARARRAGLEPAANGK